MSGLRPAIAPGEVMPRPAACEMNGQVLMASDTTSGARIGATVSGPTWGIWGFGEKLHKGTTDQSTETTDARYGELSGIRNIGPWGFSAGGGGGDDSSLRPSYMLLGDITRRFTSIRTALYAGHTRTAYNGTSRSLYRFYRIGSFVNVFPDLDLNLNFQILERSIEGESSVRRGSSGGVSLTRSAGEHQIGASASASCLGNQLLCKGGALERYAEFFINGRIAIAPTYGLIGKVGYTRQSSGSGSGNEAPGTQNAPPGTQIWFGGYQRL